MHSIAARILGVQLLLLAACDSPGRVEMDGPGFADAWRTASSENVPATDAKPLIEILAAVNERYYRKKDDSVVWDDHLSYFPWVWTAAQKKKFAGTEDVASMILQWSDVEFFRTGEFATVRVRGVKEAVVTGGLDPKNGGTFFEGKCLFRKLPEGWRLKDSFPRAMQRGQDSWARMLFSEAYDAQSRANDSIKEREPAPGWAADGEITRVLRVALEEFRTLRTFPLSDMTLFMFSERLAVRRFAYQTLVSVFKVDFGYSERLYDPSDPDSLKWYNGWEEWMNRTYPKRQRQPVPWPD